MWPLVLGAAAVAGGGLLSANSASKAAKAQNAAAAQSEALYNQQTLLGMARQAMALYGGERGKQFLQGALPREQFDQLFGRASSTRNLTESERARLNTIQARLDAIGGARGRGDMFGNGGESRGAAERANAEERRRLEAEMAEINGRAGIDPGVTAMLDTGAYAGQQGYLGQMNDLAAQFEGRGNQVMSGYNADTRRLLQGSRRIEDQASQFGTQERKRINREVDTGMTNANRAALARLAASGLGDSTLVANQYGANATNFENTRQDQLGMLGDRQIGLLSGLRQNTLGLDNQRSTLGSQMRLSLNDQALGLRQQPLQTEIGVLTGNAFNPYLNQNTSQYFPGASPGAAAGATFGNALGAIGGQAMNYGMMQYGAQQSGRGGGYTGMGRVEVDSNGRRY